MDIGCRLLGHETLDGASNMALDEALLDSVAANPSFSVVRTYEWSAPTLSLGYFQEFAEALDDPRWFDVPIVRRPTGGGALWHDREITYAVVIPSTHPAARPSRTLYRTIHEAIAGTLRTLDVEAVRRGSSVDPGETARRPFLCFTDRDSEDIVCGTAKLVGSAQRRRSGAVLQHGSLLLARSPITPELPGLADLSKSLKSPLDWSEILQAVLAESLGGIARPDSISEAERRRAGSLRDEVYHVDSWTRRR